MSYKLLTSISYWLFQGQVKKKPYSTVFPEGNYTDELIHHAQDIILNSPLGNHKSDRNFGHMQSAL